MDEDQYKKDLADAGVDLPELKADDDAAAKAKADEEAKAKADAEAKAKADEDAKAKADADAKAKDDVPLQDQPPTAPRKRSIYDDYKDKKLEVKTATERAEIAEKERDELKEKLAAIGNADTPAEKKVAENELVEFAKEIGADPAAIAKLRDLILKDAKPATDKELADRLARFEAWEKENSSAIEKSYYDKDFAKITPTLKELFPTVDEKEMEAIKTELDTISHTKQWHDKDLGYVAFMNKDKLGALVSPKKRGLESKGNKEGEAISKEFDPNADYSKMTPEEREAWEKEYNAMTKSEGLLTDSQGRKSIL